MMILPFTITIPASTNQRTELDKETIPEGVITRVYIDIPSGWAYTAGIQIEVNGDLILPTPTKNEGFITGDDTNLEFRIYKRVSEGELRILGVNFDSNDHSCVIFVELLTGDEIRVMKEIECLA